ncbi:MFS transporter [Xylanimonas allomyrinae]|uniref:Putative proline/betaine transporter n=1 Tax=Xylanimonas allomyrinae TaxID=2509459 RepID=A0A4V0YE29_9MICO|nr:MFS transporter [Xylanimonas allomyrinae]QAY62771.1 MFS transporter [Xylanimonas allomyrinae]
MALEGSTTVLSTKRKEDRRVALATLVGTSIEWYDFFIYANAAALVLAPLYFDPFTASGSEVAGRILSFATVGVSFLFRPLGAIVSGHLGDRVGRKAMLVGTLLLMGLSTALIGLVPTHAQIGVAAPVLLVLLRIVQGFSAGGEWGGAALMAVEHAPARKRGLFGGFPQIGVPIGMLVATGVLAIVTATTTDEQFLSWGWRVPFLMSIALVAVGLVIRLGVSESPVFKELNEAAEQEQVKMPVLEVMRYCWPAILLGALTFTANNGNGYMITGGYILSYSTNDLGVNRASILGAVTIAAAVWGVTTMVGAAWSDKVGRTTVYKVGFVWMLLWAFPLFWIIDTTNPTLIGLSMSVLAVGLGLTYGPQAALFTEMFPAKVRYSGAALAYAFGAILGGAFSPLIATWLQATFKTSASVSTYLAILSVIALTATFLIKDRTGRPLDASATDIPGAQRLEAALQDAPR